MSRKSQKPLFQLSEVKPLEIKPVTFESVEIEDLMKARPILAKGAATGPLNPGPCPHCKRALTYVGSADGQHEFACKNRGCGVLTSWKWGRAPIPEGLRMVLEHLQEMQRIGEQAGMGAVPTGEDEVVGSAGEAGVASGDSRHAPALAEHRGTSGSGRTGGGDGLVDPDPKVRGDAEG